MQTTTIENIVSDDGTKVKTITKIVYDNGDIDTRERTRPVSVITADLTKKQEQVNKIQQDIQSLQDVVAKSVTKIEASNVDTTEPTN